MASTSSLSSRSPAPSAVSPPARAVTVRHTAAECTQVTVVGRLDELAGAAIDDVCRRAVADATRRLELDLCAVSAYDAAGCASLARAMMLGRRLTDGVHVTVTSDAGREALLASMAYI